MRGAGWRSRGRWRGGERRAHILRRRRTRTTKNKFTTTPSTTTNTYDRSTQPSQSRTGAVASSASRAPSPLRCSLALHTLPRPPTPPKRLTTTPLPRISPLPPRKSTGAWPRSCIFPPRSTAGPRSSTRPDTRTLSLYPSTCPFRPNRRPSSPRRPATRNSTTLARRQRQWRTPSPPPALAR